ncbi:MAG TPA: sulfite dehydrogenase [Gammaproteobacteria bacterium]|nr:sulfite dehydrogenase [Gammaproteobacteria bacterium]
MSSKKARKLSNQDYDEATRNQIEGMIKAEAKAIASRKGAVEAEECECKDGMFPSGPVRSDVTSRRQFLAATATGATALMVGSAAQAAAPPGAMDYPVQEDPTKVQGRLTNDDGGYGSRSQFETEVRWRFPTATKESSWTMTPLDAGEGIVTPSGLHFERHHGGIPNINPATHSLTVHGMVDGARKYSMEDLKRFPSVSRFHFIECSGNGLTEWREPTLKTVQGTHGLTSTTEWTGVPLSTILREVGVQDGAAWILAEGSDAAVMTRSVPIDKAWDDAMLVYAQNGEALRPEQGYPLRLLLPGFEGNTHIKWLRRLEISDKPFMTREETSKYTDLLSSGKARQFSFTMEAKSVITFPSGEMKLPRAGFYEISGLAWSGRGVIKRAEVSVDGGNSWQLAELQSPVMPVCHTRFRFPWHWDGKPAILQSRCQDETGYVQPTIKQLVDARGLGGGKYGSIYHLNGIQSWAVAADGGVSNVHKY